ncbi:t-SNARE [Rhizopus microsporus ATCC 52813]|uniref:t-SNARE n=1 Tax=Rhizopus microsporus ATCC 52813 TaxID=1340429 RepID=A0A2G4SSU3_RHIZD|nr:t-SNARE [Rhizopus microsporus ATCC 52813]PHZ11830.1 t-SNARE [Rhizopus microsporus ATCC 52813]
MATRSRTLLFLQYRNSYARAQSSAPHFSAGASETEGLIESSDHVIEMSVLPPQWTDIVEEIDEALDAIKDKITRLKGMHRKHLLPGFDDRSSDEAAIEALTTEITNEFYRIKRDIQRIGVGKNASNQESVITRNIQTSLATKVQEVSSSFRKIQSSYLQSKLGDLRSNLTLYMIIEMQGQENKKGFTESQLAVLESSEHNIDQREKEINQIAKSIHQLAEIFRDLQTLVLDQGTVLDRIDYNIEQTNIQVKEAVVQLDKGAKYQSKTRKRKLMLLLILIIMLLIVILIVKPKRR